MNKNDSIIKSKGSRRTEMKKFFIGQAVIYKGLIYRIEDVIYSEKKGFKYQIAGYSRPMPAYIEGEYAGYQVGDIEKIFLKEDELIPYVNA